MMQRLRDQMGEHAAEVSLTDEAKDLLVDKGYDPTMGARPLRRAIQRFIEDPLADFVLGRDLKPGSTILVDKKRVPTTRSTSRSSRAFRRRSPRRSPSCPRSPPPKATMTPLTRARPSQLVVRGGAPG